MHQTIRSVFILAAALGCAHTRPRFVTLADDPPAAATVPPDAPTGPAGPTARLSIATPEALREEHLAIQAALIAATQEPPPIGPAAMELARVAQPHFAREDEIALPPLGLLPALAAGDRNPALRDVLPLTDALRAELPQMLDQHAAIGAAARHLEDVAVQNGDIESQLLARVLMAHARAEEQLFYPAAILVGELVRLRTEGPKAER